MSDYTPASNALAATEQASALDAEERKQTAYNALANTYGVALAGDPDTTLKAQEYKQREVINPIAADQARSNLAGTNLENTGKQETNNFNALANPKKLAGLDLENTGRQDQNTQTEQTTDFNAQLQPGKVAQQGAQLDQTKAQTGLTKAETGHANVETQAARFSLNTAQAAQDRQGAMGILASLSDTASNGGDIGGAFDKLAPLIAKYEGIDPSHLPPLREALVRDPVGTINQLSEAINAAQMTAMGGKGGAGALAMLKFSQGQMSLKDGLNFTQQRVAAVPALTDQMNALVPQLSTVATVRKAKELIPGTPEYKFHQLVEQLKPNLSLDDIRTLKASGTSLGRVTNQEMSMAANAIGNMDLGQDTSTLRANLSRIKTTYGLVNQNVQADIDRIGTGGTGVVRQARTPLNQQQANAPVKFQNGTVYTDAQGNRATTKDGGKTWVPVQ